MDILNQDTLAAKKSISDSCSLPTITIAIPAKNEAENIKAVIDTFLSSAYPNIVEILVADSGSSDNTQTIAQELARTIPKVHYLENPSGLRASGLNLMLARAKGDIFLRADAHAEYATDYVERCVEVLIRSQAQNVGGAQRAIAKTAFQAGVAIAYRSIWANGGAKYRDPNYNGYVTTVYLGCFWRADLLKVAGYSTEIPSEDAELNLRLIETELAQIDTDSFLCSSIKKKPLRIYISSDIKVWYYPRKTWRSLWQQYFDYGRGRFLLVSKYPFNLQLRGKLPLLSLCFSLFVTLANIFLFKINLFFLKLGIVILLFVVLDSLYLNLRLSGAFEIETWRGTHQSIPSFWIRCCLCSIAVLTMPSAHAFGYGYQLWRCKVLRIRTW